MSQVSVNGRHGVPCDATHCKHSNAAHCAFNLRITAFDAALKSCMARIAAEEANQKITEKPEVEEPQ
jgi:hypothetical protein